MFLAGLFLNSLDSAGSMQELLLVKKEERGKVYGRPGGLNLPVLPELYDVRPT